MTRGGWGSAVIAEMHARDDHRACRACGATAAPVARDPGPPQPRYRSKLEEAYAGRLEAMRRAGEIDGYRHEAIRLVIGPGLTYRPDFVVFVAGAVELHEVKGARSAGGRPDREGRAKFLAAVTQWPMFRFRLITRDRDGWHVEELS